MPSKKVRWVFPKGMNPRRPDKVSWSWTVPKAPDPFAFKNLGPFVVAGRNAGSVNEYNVAVALGMLNLTFDYQVSILGGKRIPGGRVIDFMIDTTPLRTPLWVQGDYWHGNAAKREADQFAMKHVNQAFSYQVAESVEIWGHQTNTIADALANLKQLLRI